MVPLIHALLAAALAQTPAPAPQERPLTPGAMVRDSMSGGSRAVYTFDVPAGTAARVLIKQEGIDIGLMLRVKGSTWPPHGLNFTSGPAGEERAYPAVSDAPASYVLTVTAALPRAARGDYELTLDLVPADERARAIASAWAQHYNASETAWVGDGAAFRKALSEYAEAAKAAAAAGEPTIAAEAIYQCARTHDLTGDVPGAMELQKRALAMFEALGRRDRQARVLNRLGDLARKLGDVIEAEAYFERAMPLARDAGDPAAVAEINNNWGLLMMATSRYEEALRRFEPALPLAQETNARDVEITLNANIGETYKRLGQFDKAVAALERAASLVPTNNERRVARTLQMLASAQFDAGDRARANATMQRALDAFGRAQDPAQEANALIAFGRMRHTEGDITAAVDLFTRAAPGVRASRDLGGEADLLTAWAEALVDRGELDEAIAKLDAALPLHRLVRDREGEAQTQYVRALALQKRGRSSEAIDAVSAATSIVESMRGAMVRTSLRTSYLSAVKSYFDLQIDLLQRQGATAAAFETSERSRARTLLEGLAESESKIRKGVDRRLLERQHDIQTALNAKENYRALVVSTGGERDERVASADRDIARLIDELNVVLADIRRSSPEFAALKAPQPITIARLQQALLDADSVLVEFHLGAQRGYAWVVDRRSITVHRLASPSSIDVLARRYHALLSRDLAGLNVAGRDKLAADIATAGRRLADAAWTPVAARVKGKRVLIVADGVLQYVPFAALPSAAGTPLIAEHEIGYLPSASVLDTLRRNSRTLAAGAPIAVFADPVFSNEDGRLTGRPAPPARAATERSGNGYPRLRFSRNEAEAIAASSRGVFQALDFTAAKQTLTASDLRRYRVLHFATHGVLNTGHPELSGLVLSLVDPAGRPLDGFLRLHEIYNLDLDADLVVLSACRTALGKDVHGEGLIGLTRGFMYAGATRVVSSVWNVDDRASALLMSRFYEAMLTRGRPPSAALREAQLSLLAEPRWANPHYWAAFGLQGDWR